MTAVRVVASVTDLVGAGRATMTAVRVVAFVTDLMDRSKIAPVGDVAFAREPAEAAGADVVVVDLGRHADAVAALRAVAPDARLVCFGRHTEARALAQAVEDGADAALPRSSFFADVAAAVSGAVSGQTRGQG